MHTTRRRFLKTAVVAGMAAGSFPFLRAAEPKPYKTVLIGAGWWGMNILGEAIASRACTVAGLCDVDDRMLDPALDKVKQLTGNPPARYKDFREILEREKPDIAIVGTPDHWHPLITIAAVKAGAHVYVEKPIGHTCKEGRAMVNAARKYGRTVQVGTHRRVSPHNVSGREFIRSGKLGRLGMIRAFVHYGGGPEKPRKNSEPPKGLDWDMWCGPAPLRPFNGDPDNPWSGGIHPRGFRSYLDYANGTLGDWGIHWMDQILWITDARWPRKIFSTGGRPIKGPPVLTAEEQTSDAPDHQVATFEFPDFTVSWEHRQFSGNNAEKGESVGCYFYGTEGTFHMGWKDGWTFYPADGRKPVIHEKPQLHAPDDQNIKELWADFLEAIRTGRQPVSDIEAVHRSTNVSLLGMLSYKLGRSLHWDGDKEQVLDDAEANQLLSRKYRSPWIYPEAT
ncbi:MAG TPA: Gfo/Idh/MocA family oxidoreductase [Candidatus Paceibacterota bacterium]|nr:Gfo/Idh/MocA family oxidoreductase [Verrucomicrobiota bacterium]HRY50532.1 Gfo/Idh/MocA family oxidoreductase [Candidatus Paceibacterota bacterium]HRZ99974.1 Gfo/Idh/MocA family oxidoreductase [Candidatus Paceibacterota bacterium]